jgi:hypothetical protein
MIILNNVKEALTNDIKKIVGNLKNDEQLTEILKRKLTKKEFKYYKLKIEGNDESKIAEELHCDKERFEEIKKQTIVKLNQEKIKKELVNL